MKHLLYAAAAAVAAAASSCSGNADAVMGRVDVASAISSPSELKVSDIGKTIRYVPLATGDSSLVANRWKLRVVGGRAVVCNTGSSAAGAGSSVLAFDLADGRFLNHIGHAGQDPDTIGKTKRRVGEKRNVGKSEKRSVVKIETKRKREKPRARQKRRIF